MATRGTYLINGSLNYNHWDNYPSGTAYHLFNSIKKTGGIKTYDFIRGIDKLEPTKSIYDGRAEYHYKIEGDFINCYSIPMDKDTLVPVSSGNIIDWINDNLELEPTDKKDNYTLCKYSGTYMTVAKAKKEIRKDFKFAEAWLLKGIIGNASSKFHDIFKSANKAGIKIDFLKNKYLKKYVPIFVKSYNHSSPDHFAGYVNE